jgi:hypothetical protein
MIRVKCPRCAQPVTAEKPPADGLLQCRCGQKLRLKQPTAPPGPARPAQGAGGPPPARAASTPPPAKAPRGRPVGRAGDEDPEELEEAVLLDEGEDAGPPPAPPRTRPRPVVVDEDEDEAPVVRRAPRPKFAPLDEDDAEPEPEPEADEEPRPKKRRKKKKKKQTGPPGLKGVHVALIGGGIGFVLLLTLGLFFAFKGGSKPKADPEEVSAEVSKAGGMVERDPNSPTKEVTRVSLTGSTEKLGFLLGKIKDAFPNLRTLDLSGTLTSDIDLEHLEGYTSLRVLRLGNTKVTSGGMQFLKGMTGLEELDLGGTLVTDAGLEELKGLKNLKKLNLSNTPLASGRGLAAAIPGLEVSN